MRSRTAVSGTAASTAVAHLLLGAPCPLEVVAASTHALYLAAPDGHVVLAAVTRSAVRVPIAVVLAGTLPQMNVGDVAQAGDGALWLGGRRHDVTRWFDPAVPALAASSAGANPAPVPIERIGEGPGFTPSADDEVCGALAALHALRRHDVLAVVVPRVLAATGRTTPVSAAFLRAAAAGDAVPELTAYLRALATGDLDRLRTARTALLAVGHTSGAAMAAGADRVWEAA